MSGIANIGCRPLIQNNSQPLKTVNFKGSEDIEDLLESFEESKKSDKPKDRNFDINKALSNFGKGFISPITTMFSSATNFVVGAGTIAICSGLMKATNNKIGKVFVVAGILYGGIQSALGISKAVKAENNDEREKAFYDIGAGTGVMAASAVVAKPTLEAAGLEAVEAESISITKSTLECFKGLPESLGQSLSVLNDTKFMTGLFSGTANKVTGSLEAGQASSLGRLLTKNGAGVVASTEEHQADKID